MLSIVRQGLRARICASERGTQVSPKLNQALSQLRAYQFVSKQIHNESVRGQGSNALNKTSTAMRSSTRYWLASSAASSSMRDAQSSIGTSVSLAKTSKLGPC